MVIPDPAYSELMDACGRWCTFFRTLVWLKEEYLTTDGEPAPEMLYYDPSVDHALVFVVTGQNYNLLFSAICFIVSLTLSEIFTVPTPKIEVCKVSLIGLVQYFGILSIPFAIPMIEPTVAPLQSVSKPVSTAMQIDFPNAPPPYSNAATTIIALEMV